jgi:hypothetical protein
VKYRYSVRRTVVSLSFATGLLALEVYDLSDGAISVRHDLHAYPSPMYTLDVSGMAALSLLVAVSWVKTVRRRRSVRDERDS